jgi:hypothetical protein
MTDEVKKVDVLTAMRRLDRALEKLSPEDKALALTYLNSKHGEPK